MGYSFAFIDKISMFLRGQQQLHRGPVEWHGMQERVGRQRVCLYFGSGSGPGRLHVDRFMRHAAPMAHPVASLLLRS